MRVQSRWDKSARIYPRSAGAENSGPAKDGKPLTGQGRVHKWFTEFSSTEAVCPLLKLMVTSQDTVKETCIFSMLLLNRLRAIALKAVVFRQNMHWKKISPLPFCSWKILKNPYPGWCAAQDSCSAWCRARRADPAMSFDNSKSLCILLMVSHASWALVWHSIPGQPQLQMLTSSSGSSQSISCAFFPFPMHLRFSESSSHLRCYTLIQITPSQSPSTTAFTRNSAKVHNGWGILNPFQGRFNSSSQEDSDSCCSLSPALTPTQLPLLPEHQPTLTYPLQPTGHHMSHSPCIWGLGLAGVLAQPSRRPFMHKDQQISKAG